jgi:ABC-type transport system substrate-binding protein
MVECRQHRGGADRQMADPDTYGSEDRVGDSRTNYSCCWLAQPDWHLRAGQKLDFDFRHITDAQRRVGVEVGIPRLAVAGVDDPDAQFYENYACGSDRNYTGYCNPELDRLFDEQSMEADQNKRRHLVREIDKKLQEDGARPILYHNRFATCRQPQVKGLTIMVNSLFNGWRMEDVWLER